MPHPIQTKERMTLVEQVAQLAPSFSSRSAQYDRDASFPYENWTELAAEGFLGLCAPKEYGGYEADFVGYALVSEELARACPTTALTFNMHTATALLAGWISEELDFDNEMKQHLKRTRPALWEGMCSQHLIHSQPFSEGRSLGSTSPVNTIAVPVAGGYRVTGRKIFASLSGAADIHNVVAIVEGDRRLRLLGVPAGSEGLSVEGVWDPLGMRGTDSRNLIMNNVFVPGDNEVVPPGAFDAMSRRFPYFYMTLSFSYLGLMKAVIDTTEEYLRGEHGVESRKDNHIKQAGWAGMQLKYDQTQALMYRVLEESSVDPSPAALRRAWSAMITTMEGAPAIASEAIRICGGRSMLRPSKLEQHYRDARCGATMLPWSVEVCLDRLGRAGLY